MALLFFFGLSTTCLAQKQEQDYTKYHQGVINAETAIFVDKQPDRGLKIFSSTFEQFDFAFVDDCIEAFQLALFYKKEDYAIIFLKKAMDNGFEIELLNQLVHDCPCEHHKRTEINGALHAAFIKKHRDQLENYSTEAYAEYISRIDSELLRKILNRHMREQLFKDYKAGLSSTGLPKERAIKQQKIEYQRICDDNLRFIDSLARKNIFIGERNLGIYTEKLAEALKITPVAQQRVLMVTFYGLPASTYVPNNSEADYFGINPVYNMLFHNARSFGVLSPYSSEAIRRGYLHPREYASLAYNRPGARDTSMLLTACPEVNSAKEVNDSRRDFLLPPYEVDYQKRLFAHNHNLQLFFGFRGYEK